MRLFVDQPALAGGDTTCRQRQVIDDRFDQDFVLKKVQQYHRSGLKKETKILVEALKSEGVDGLTLLDVGGGLGAIEHELIKAGVIQADC
jgi:magnesium-protoporphyrin O-methyltransferase